MRAALLTSAIILTAIFSFAVYQPTLLAVDVLKPICDANSDPSVCDRDQGQTPRDNVLVGPDGMITRATQVLVYISGVLAMILIIIAGFMFIFSGGRPESISRARSAIIYALAGMVIAIVGQLIVLFVLNRL